jgi:AcrR family transcriptional regulator
MNGHLTKSDWIEHGLRTLASDGANALKSGPMATPLKVSRGSFYWHFRDIARFFDRRFCSAGRSARQIGLFATSRRPKPNQTGSNSL